MYRYKLATLFYWVPNIAVNAKIANFVEPQMLPQFTA